MRRTRFATLLVPVLALGCGDDPAGPPYADFSGEWRGSLTGISVRLYLTDSDGDVSGTGILSAAQTLNITVSGDHDHPDVDFTAYATGYNSFRTRAGSSTAIRSTALPTDPASRAIACC